MPIGLPSTGPGASSPSLAVHDAVKSFGDVRALAGASLQVGRGELVALLGPNGAGKTTLLKAIAGRLRLDRGTVRLFGRELTPADPRPDLGVVPQELAVYPLLTATENLEVFGRLYGVAKSQLALRVRWALEWSDLKDRALEPVKRFSGGMKRRLNIACSLVHEPSLVLLDEPTVGVDPQSRERIYEMLASLRKTGVSIVLTTHHLEEAEQRCERVVIIDHGRIVAAGTVGELVAGTLGGGRTLRVSLARPLPDAAHLPGEVSFDETRRILTMRVSPTGEDLGRLLASIQTAGGAIDDLALTGTSLQDVFISLTGRELRE